MIQWKKLILSTIAALGIACFAGGTADAANINLNEKTFPDPYVYHYVQEMCEYDTAHSTYYLPEAEKVGVTYFVVTGKTFFRYGLDGELFEYPISNAGTQVQYRRKSAGRLEF